MSTLLGGIFNKPQNQQLVTLILLFFFLFWTPHLPRQFTDYIAFCTCYDQICQNFVLVTLKVPSNPKHVIHFASVKCKEKIRYRGGLAAGVSLAGEPPARDLTSHYSLQAPAADLQIPTSRRHSQPVKRYNSYVSHQIASANFRIWKVLKISFYLKIVFFLVV